MLLLLFLQVLGTLYIPTLTADIVNRGIVTGDLDHIWRVGGFMLLAAILTAGVSVAVTYLTTWIFSIMGRDIRNALFQKSQSLSLNEFNRFGTASMITRCTNDITQIQQAYMAAIEMLLPAPVMTVAGLSLAFSKDTLLAFSIIGAMLVVCLFAFLVSRKALPMFARLQSLLDRITRVLRENLTGIRVIRAFNRSDSEKERVDQTFTDYAETAIRINKIFAAMMPVILIITPC